MQVRFYVTKKHRKNSVSAQSRVHTEVKLAFLFAVYEMSAFNS